MGGLSIPRKQFVCLQKEHMLSMVSGSICIDYVITGCTTGSGLSCCLLLSYISFAKLAFGFQFRFEVMDVSREKWALIFFRSLLYFLEVSFFYLMGGQQHFQQMFFTGYCIIIFQVASKSRCFHVFDLSPPDTLTQTADSTAAAL